jgi:hypothetical protein
MASCARTVTGIAVATPESTVVVPSASARPATTPPIERLIVFRLSLVMVAVVDPVDRTFPVPPVPS